VRRNCARSIRPPAISLGVRRRGDDTPLDPMPASLDDALKRLDDASERLNKHLSKTSRRVISVSVVEVANEVTHW